MREGHSVSSRQAARGARVTIYRRFGRHKLHGPRRSAALPEALSATDALVLLFLGLRLRGACRDPDRGGEEWERRDEPLETVGEN